MFDNNDDSLGKLLHDIKVALVMKLLEDLTRATDPYDVVFPDEINVIRLATVALADRKACLRATIALNQIVKDTALESGDSGILSGLKMIEGKMDELFERCEAELAELEEQDNG